RFVAFTLLESRRVGRGGATRGTVRVRRALHALEAEPVPAVLQPVLPSGVTEARRAGAEVAAAGAARAPAPAPRGPSPHAATGELAPTPLARRSRTDPDLNRHKELGRARGRVGIRS